MFAELQILRIVYVCGDEVEANLAICCNDFVLIRATAMAASSALLIVFVGPIPDGLTVNCICFSSQ